MVEQPLPHRGDGVEALGPVAHHRAADLLGGGGLDVGDAVAGVPLLERDRPRGHVEHREHAHGHAPGLELGAGVRAQHVGPVGEHDALGHAGRAAGEEHDVRVGLPQVGSGCGGGVGRRRARPGSAARRAAIGRPLVDRVEHRPPHAGRQVEPGQGVGPPGVGQHDRRVGDVEHRRRLGRREQRAHRAEHRPDRRAPDEHRHHLERGRRPHRHPVAGAHPEGVEPGGHVRAERPQLGERQRAVAQRRGHAVRDGHRRLLEDVPDQQLHRSASRRFLVLACVPYSWSPNAGPNGEVSDPRPGTTPGRW